MTTCRIPFSREQLDLAKEVVRRAIIQDMNTATTIIEDWTPARQSESAIRIAVERNDASNRALLALLDHLNTVHFQSSQTISRRVSTARGA